MMFGLPKIGAILLVAAGGLVIASLVVGRVCRARFYRWARTHGYPPRPDDVDFDAYREAILKHRRQASADRVQAAADERARKIDDLIAQFPEPDDPGMHRGDVEEPPGGDRPEERQE